MNCDGALLEQAALCIVALFASPSYDTVEFRQNPPLRLWTSVCAFPAVPSEI
jgi:hypothetical protein